MVPFAVWHDPAWNPKADFQVCVTQLADVPEPSSAAASSRTQCSPHSVFRSAGSTELTPIVAVNVQPPLNDLGLSSSHTSFNGRDRTSKPTYSVSLSCQIVRISSSLRLTVARDTSIRSAISSTVKPSIRSSAMSRSVLSSSNSSIS